MTISQTKYDVAVDDIIRLRAINTNLLEACKSAKQTLLNLSASELTTNASTIAMNAAVGLGTAIYRAKESER